MFVPLIMWFRHLLLSLVIASQMPSHQEANYKASAQLYRLATYQEEGEENDLRNLPSYYSSEESTLAESQSQGQLRPRPRQKRKCTIL